MLEWKQADAPYKDCLVCDGVIIFGHEGKSDDWKEARYWEAKYKDYVIKKRWRTKF